MLRSATLVLAAAAALAAGGAGAQDLQAAQTPSHNIFCLATPPDGNQPRQLRCDIEQATSRPPKPPRNCPLSWGDAFGIDPTGPGYLICHGDTVQNGDAPVIAYGAQWRAYGFTCTSQTTGLTYVNAQGHGFTISRAAQKVF